MSVNDGAATFLTTHDFKKRAQKGETFSDEKVLLRKQYVADDISLIKSSDEDKDSRSVRFVISTGAVDRERDVISPKGWDLKHFRKNPVVLFAHDNRRPPIGRGFDLEKGDEALKASVEFMDNETDTSGFSDMIFRMIKGGFLRATSVGFLPKEWEFEDEDADRVFGINFSKQELLEFSIVPVPANPEALIEARSKGIDTAPLQTWLQEALDCWTDFKGMLLVPKSQVEQIAKYADPKSKKSVFVLSPDEQDRLLKQNIDAAKAQKGPDPEAEKLEAKATDTPETEPDTSEKEPETAETTEKQPDSAAEPADPPEKAANGHDNAPIRLKVVGDGRPQSTFIVDAETGRRIANIRSFNLSMGVDSLLVGDIRLIEPEIDLELPLVDINAKSDGELEADGTQPADLVASDGAGEEAPSDDTTPSTETGPPAATTDELEPATAASATEPEADNEEEYSLELAEGESEPEPAEPDNEPQLDPDQLHSVIAELLPDVTREIVSAEIKRLMGRVD